MTEKTAKSVAIYARVSTSTGSQDNEVQLRQLREYVKNRSFSIYREYTDEMSGARDDRPSFKKMMDDVSYQRNIHQNVVRISKRDPAG